MNDRSITIMMWLGGGLLTLLFFFISFYFYRSIKAYDDLSESVNKLQLTLTGLNGIILSIQDKNELNTSICKERHSEVERRLSDHKRRLDEHEKIIIKLDAIHEKNN